MTYVIAEIGSNHDGYLHEAKLLLTSAALAGADAVKFQCLPNFPREWLPKLMDQGRSLGVDVFATPFDVEAVAYLARLGVPRIKIASAELVNDPLLEAATETEIPLLISTGMASIGEVWETLRIVGRSDVTMLQCTSLYPTPATLINLKAMVNMGQALNVPYGLSDHSRSTAIPAAAVALGATVIEKHLTLSRLNEGPDHPFALEPQEFEAMVTGIREVEQALGDGLKTGPVDGEPIEARGRQLQWQT